jgi:hypothetical protein
MEAEKCLRQAFRQAQNWNPLGSFKATALNTDDRDQTDSHGFLSVKIRAIRVQKKFRILF